MRTYKLINSNNSAEYDLSRRVSTLWAVDGLGFGIDAEYHQIGHTFMEYDAKLEQATITGIISFFTEAEFDAFVLFCQYEPLVLGVGRDYDNYKYMRCKLKTLKKREITKRQEWASVDVDFICLGQWLKNTVPFEVTTSTDVGKKYPYTYPYTYSRGAAGTIPINNGGTMPAPLKIYIKGPCTNPSWLLIANGATVARGAVTIELIDGEQLIVDSNVDNLSIVRADLLRNTLGDAWQQSDKGRANYIYAPLGASELVISQAVGTPDAIVEVFEYVHSI